MSKNYTPGRAKATANYMKDKHTLRVVVKKVKAEEYKAAAQKHNQSLNQFIIDCIEMRLRQEADMQGSNCV